VLAGTSGPGPACAFPNAADAANLDIRAKRDALAAFSTNAHMDCGAEPKHSPQHHVVLSVKSFSKWLGETETGITFLEE